MQLRETKTRNQRRASKKQRGYFISTYDCVHRIGVVEKAQDKTNTWTDNGWKFWRTYKAQQFTDLRCPINPKQDKQKEKSGHIIVKFNN